MQGGQPLLAPWRRSVITTCPPDCKMLREKMFHRETEEEVPRHKCLKTTLVYMGDNRFCLVENFIVRTSKMSCSMSPSLVSSMITGDNYKLRFAAP
ncbi:hypothetical protein PR202_gb22062 [Eleusine coracana subsp. coracana]|uniref:Uncharacterized protein n=1 Tax=Eleusine coracana subsp. coracana TaxID=191504 RepID=A0AAV5FCQ4_ELECO|nr:hypothetical protein PR202_gb22062 [Eleusine coracana subsp. coracana]